MGCFGRRLLRPRSGGPRSPDVPHARRSCATGGLEGSSGTRGFGGALRSCGIRVLGACALLRVYRRGRSQLERHRPALLRAFGRPRVCRGGRGRSSFPVRRRPLWKRVALLLRHLFRDGARARSALCGRSGAGIFGRCAAVPRGDVFAPVRAQRAHARDVFEGIAVPACGVPVRQRAFRGAVLGACGCELLFAYPRRFLRGRRRGAGAHPRVRCPSARRHVRERVFEGVESGAHGGRVSAGALLAADDVRLRAASPRHRRPRPRRRHAARPGVAGHCRGTGSGHRRVSDPFHGESGAALVGCASRCGKGGAQGSLRCSRGTTRPHSARGEILYYISLGYSSKAIAEKLFVAPGTVQSHTKRIYAKLGVHAKQELIELVNREEGDG
ncbi:MAG: response regulator transcription factor [Adlercreutzia sp.]